MTRLQAIILAACLLTGCQTGMSLEQVAHYCAVHSEGTDTAVENCYYDLDLELPQ